MNDLFFKDGLIDVGHDFAVKATLYYNNHYKSFSADDVKGIKNALKSWKTVMDVHTGKEVNALLRVVKSDKLKAALYAMLVKNAVDCDRFKTRDTFAEYPELEWVILTGELRDEFRRVYNKYRAFCLSDVRYMRLYIALNCDGATNTNAFLIKDVYLALQCVEIVCNASDLEYYDYIDDVQRLHALWQIGYNSLGRVFF